MARTRTLAPVPRFTGKTVIGLLKAVQRAILVEPRRADMTTFLERRSRTQGGPACGTVGCFAGWVALLGRPAKFARLPVNDDYVNIGLNIGSTMLTARQLLGDDLNYNLPLIAPYGLPYDVFNAGGGDACGSTRPGTKDHARAVVARIDRFMEINAKKLHGRLVRRTR